MPAAQRAQPPALAHADLWFARDRETSPARVACHGWLLLAATTLGCGAMLYATLLAKLLPRTGHALLDAVREDEYYCLLVPSTLVATLVAVYLNWLGLKFFRHN